jgi:hypothetical protein
VEGGESSVVDDDGPVAKKRKIAPAVAKGKAKGKKGKGKKKEKEPAFVPTVPFPEHFVKLEKTFKVNVLSAPSSVRHRFRARLSWCSLR